MPADTLTPHDLDAERALLGAALIDSSRLLEAIAVGVTPAHLFREGHRRTFRAMCDLSATGTPIDLVTLVARLRESGDLDESGGPAYLAGLTDGVPRSANARAYVDIILAKARDREFAGALTRVQDIISTKGTDSALDYLSPYLTDTRRSQSVRLLSGLDLVVATDPVPLHSSWPMLARGSVTAVVGASGTGKTFLSIRIVADLLSAGHRVLVCALEGFGGLRGRVLAACSAFGLEDADLGRLMFVDALQLGEPACLRAVIAAAGPVDLVVIDTFARALGDLDENSANAVGAALNACVRIGRESGNAGVLLIHHTTKGTGAERGSSAFRAGVDSLAFLEDEGEQRVLRVEKMRDADCPMARVFRLRALPEFGSAVLDDADRVLPAGTEAELSHKTQHVLKELRMVGRASATELSENLKGRVGRTTVFGALHDLERLGLARQDRGAWCVTSPGSSEQSGRSNPVRSGIRLTSD